MRGPFVVLAALAAGGWVCWRYRWFFRDPDRKIPQGRCSVAPADGKVVYAHLVSDGELPIAVKQGHSIRLEEVTKTGLPPDAYWQIGVFMFPWSEHVNRIPLDGEVVLAQHYVHANAPMSTMYIRGALGLKPMYSKSIHITENERCTLRVDGDLCLSMWCRSPMPSRSRHDRVCHV